MNDMKCPNCNTTEHELGAKYCHMCGFLLHDSLNHSRRFLNNKWFISIIMALLIVLLCVYLRPYISQKSLSSRRTSSEMITTREVFPQDLSGNYIVRSINGQNDINSTIKIYHEGDGYAMNVYSSNITRKYILSYDPSTGEIYADELGRGMAIIKKTTNETKISFEGWELLK